MAPTPGTVPSGRFVRRPGGFEAFVPDPLPPAIHVDPDLGLRLATASHALGRLDGIAGSVPDRGLFLFTYIRREAVLSSQIEGTQASLMDVLEYEAALRSPSQSMDVREILNYVSAIEYGLKRLETLPVSRALLCEVHAVLMRDVRGGEPSRTPGEFRRSQNWIGGSSPSNAAFVPPPPGDVDESFSRLERFLHDESEPIPPLIRIGLAHAQFETIHPFLDGNGRLGRLLIAFWLAEKGLLRDPLLYLSLFLKRHRDTYYRLLQETRVTGNWRGWLSFFLEGVTSVASEAADTAHRINALRDTLRRNMHDTMGRRAGNALRLLDDLFRAPGVTVDGARQVLGTSQPTALALVNAFVDAGILKEITGKKRNRFFFFADYIALFPEAEVTS
jgi:Fic family protein